MPPPQAQQALKPALEALLTIILEGDANAARIRTAFAGYAARLVCRSPEDRTARLCSGRAGAFLAWRQPRSASTVLIAFPRPARSASSSAPSTPTCVNYRNPKPSCQSRTSSTSNMSCRTPVGPLDRLNASCWDHFLTWSVVVLATVLCQLRPSIQTVK